MSPAYSIAVSAEWMRRKSILRRHGMKSRDNAVSPALDRLATLMWIDQDRTARMQATCDGWPGSIGP